jgi:hypothetical protein
MNDHMLSSSADLARPARNKGKLTGPKPPLRPGRQRAPEQDGAFRPVRDGAAVKGYSEEG